MKQRKGFDKPIKITHLRDSNLALSEKVRLEFKVIEKEIPLCALEIAAVCEWNVVKRHYMGTEHIDHQIKFKHSNEWVMEYHVHPLCSTDGINCRLNHLHDLHFKYSCFSVCIKMGLIKNSCWPFSKWLYCSRSLIVVGGLHYCIYIQCIYMIQPEIWRSYNCIIVKTISYLIYQVTFLLKYVLFEVFIYKCD